jgi:hypothetical protein
MSYGYGRSKVDDREAFLFEVNPNIGRAYLWALAIACAIVLGFCLQKSSAGLAQARETGEHVEKLTVVLPQVTQALDRLDSYMMQMDTRLTDVEAARIKPAE